jgi:NAD(P)-dependent dehydrogenase (short-subunit alcohol dehydrogenase family)
MKKYLIIGGSSGIGLQLVKQLAQDNNEVVATYFKNKPDKQIENAAYHYLDVSEENPGYEFLPDDLDGLVYCPGSINLRPFHRLKPESFLEDYKLQVLGAVKIIQAALPALKRVKNASVVLFSTVAVQRGFNFHTQVAASKGAIEGLTRSLAAELAPGVRVNCIAPSLTDTPLAEALLNTNEKRESNANRHPLKRLGEVSDMAHMAQFLLSEKSGWISGQVLHVDGGMSALRV